MPFDAHITQAAAQATRTAGGAAVIFDMAQEAGHAGARRLMAGLAGGPEALARRAADDAARKADRERRVIALRRAQARIGMKLLGAEEWSREVAAELAAMKAEGF